MFRANITPPSGGFFFFGGFHGGFHDFPPPNPACFVNDFGAKKQALFPPAKQAGDRVMTFANRRWARRNLLTMTFPNEWPKKREKPWVSM